MHSAAIDLYLKKGFLSLRLPIQDLIEGEVKERSANNQDQM